MSYYKTDCLLIKNFIKIVLLVFFLLSDDSIVLKSKAQNQNNNLNRKNGNKKVNHVHQNHNFEKYYENEIKQNNEKIPFAGLNTRSASELNDQCHLNIECGNNRHSSLRLPIYGPKGDQGPPGVMGVKGEKGEPGIAGIPARDPPPPNFSAFFAALANNTGPYKQDKDLVFTQVITNYGDNYDSTNGIYTAPYNGIYQFLITISATGRQKAGVNLMKNKQSILTVWSESEPWSTSSQTVILRLSSNDHVYLRLQGRASHVHGYMYSSFGGSLLYEEINSP